MPTDEITPSFAEKIGRIVGCAEQGPPDQLSSSLVHAYAGCLSIDEVADAIVTTWREKAIVRRAVLKKAMVYASGDESRAGIDKVGNKILAACMSDRQARKYLDSALSQLYELFSPVLRKRILDLWVDRGTASAGYRWLRAIKSDPLLFSCEELRRYWHHSLNPNAAALLAARCEQEKIRDLLPELVDRCDQGWIISRAALRADHIDCGMWLAIEEKFPATYVYLCAKKGVALTEEKALNLFRKNLDISIFGQEGGLMIWSLGQLQMWSALDQIRGMLPKARQDAEMKIRLQYGY